MQRLNPSVDFARLRALLPEHPTTRFAPSPTGYLHLGHIAHALYVWGVAAGVGAQVILRLENHDQQRCRPAYEEAIIRDLEWLGLLRVAPGTALTPLVERQSDHPQYYTAALEKLASHGLTYACRCSRKDLLSMTPPATELAAAGESTNPVLPDRELYYPGHCRQLSIDPDLPGVSLRFKLSQDQPEAFYDVALGEQVQTPSQQCGDFTLRDKHGQFTYQLAVVVDDIRHGVNLVVRGLDLLASCGRQAALRRALGGPPSPLYLHHPLLHEKVGGDKLSKSLRSASILSMREAGQSPGAVWGEAAYRLGLLSAGRRIAPQDFASLLGA